MGTIYSNAYLRFYINEAKIAYYKNESDSR